MTKRDLVVQISNDTGMIQQDVLAVVQRMLDVLSDSMANGHVIELRNFGVFEVQLRKARVGRNPNAPEKDIRIPPRAVVKFKPSKQLTARVFKLSEQLVTQNSTNSTTAQKPGPTTPATNTPVTK